MMQKTKYPITSEGAYNSQKENGKIDTWQRKIMQVMKKIKWGNQEKIAKCLDVAPIMIWRRLSELVKSGALERTDIALRSKETGALQSIYKLPQYKIEITCVKSSMTEQR